MAYKIGTCDVCTLVDNDRTYKPVQYCSACDANICAACEPNITRRAAAMAKRAAIRAESALRKFRFRK